MYSHAIQYACVMGRIRPLLLSGGFGKRYTAQTGHTIPKQFITTHDTPPSLFHQTLSRTENPLFYPAWITANIDHQAFFDVAPDHTILWEPVSRNTAAAVTIACLTLRHNGYTDPIVILPSDHIICDTDTFRQDIEKALERHVNTAGRPVLIGHPVTAPSIEMGYIRHNNAHVTGFHEKPDAAQAYRYAHDPAYLWNTGIALIDPQIFLSEITTLHPDFMRACITAFDTPDIDNYLDIPAQSLDVLYWENASDISVIEGRFDWADIGLIQQKDKAA